MRWGTGAMGKRSADFKRRQAERARQEWAQPVLENPERYHPVRVARVNKELTQVQFAQLAGMSAGRICAIEGGCKPNRNTARRIAEALKMKVETLWPK